MARLDRVVVIGQGYVGLPLTMAAVSAGFDVIGLDTDARKVEGLRAGRSHIPDIAAAEVKAALDSGRYRPTTHYVDAADFGIAVITVPTPLRESQPDLAFVEQAVRDIGPLVTKGSLVILESTSYPGTTEDVMVPGLAEASGLTAGRDFMAGFSPERIDPGNPHWTFRNTPKIVSGIDETSRKAVEGFYAKLVDTTVPVESPKEAELAKLLENTFRHVNIALVNEIAILARMLGIDIWRTIDAAATKPFGFMKFTPGPGVGGHCLPVDPSYLSWEVHRKLGRSSRFIEVANDVNNHMPDYVVQRLIEGLNGRGKPLKGSRILILGVTYKRNSADMRESPAVRVIELLKSFGPKILVADPMVDATDLPPGVEHVELTDRTVAGVDAILILTAHDAFDYDIVERSDAYVLDTQRVTTAGSCEVL